LEIDCVTLNLFRSVTAPLVALIYATAVFAQITITADEIVGVGESIVARRTTNVVAVDVGSPEANQTCTIPDYPELSPDGQWHQDVGMVREMK
jgi:hypothetical protein